MALRQNPDFKSTIDSLIPTGDEISPTKIHTLGRRLVRSGKAPVIREALKGEAGKEFEGLGSSLGSLGEMLRNLMAMLTGRKANSDSNTSTALGNTTNAGPSVKNTKDKTVSGKNIPKMNGPEEKKARAKLSEARIYGDSHARGLGEQSSSAKNGATSSFGLAQLEQDARSGNLPGHCFWCFGTNNIMADGASQAVAHAKRAIEIAKSNGVQITLVAVPPMVKGGKQGAVNALNQQYAALAQESGIQFVNPYQGMRNRSDGVHLKMADYKRAAAILGQSIA